MDLPISIGIAAALISGLINTLRGSGEIYFDSVTMLVLLLLVGRWLQARQLDRARAATDLMLSLAPATARVVGADGVVEVATDSVERGAVVEVRSGERIGVDGIVLSGSSSVDASLLSGESRPLRVEAGSLVHAGSVNLTSLLRIRALCSGKETRLHAIVRDVARAARAKAPIVVFADRVSAYFVVVVLLAAVLTAVLAWPLGMEEALGRAVALLIVTCPCALGLATPLASSLALGQAARAGILIKGGRFLELLSRPGLFVFDKTGTLTRGTLSVVDWDGDKELSALVLAAEASSAHPIAQAFRAELCASAAEASSALRSVPPAAHCEEVLGSGVRASIGGRAICVGSRRFVLARSHGHAQGLTPALQQREQALLSAGLSPVLVSVDGQVRAIAGLGDPLREEAAECLSLLIQAGHRLALLSGDRNEIVHGVARRLGVPFEQVLGEQSPEQKLAFVEARCKLGPVFMVGDGVNDAAALSAAHVGIAVCGGAEASLAAADIFSTVRGLRPLVQLIQGSRSVLRLIHKNLVFSISYNIVAAALAITGLIHPVIAAILMPLSSLTVVINTLRTRCFAAEPKVASDLQAQREQANAPLSSKEAA
jgi:P-type Cu2+ transporter